MLKFWKALSFYPKWSTLLAARDVSSFSRKNTHFAYRGICTLLCVPVKSSFCRGFHKTWNHKCDYEEWDEVAEEGILADEDVLKDPIYQQYLDEQQYLLPPGGQRVLIIQPNYKTGPKRFIITTAALQLEEGCALIRSLPNWTIFDTTTISIKTFSKKTIFGKGKYAEIGQMIRSNRQQLSAVFLNTEMLSGLQLSTLQKDWNITVYDRFTIVLQIFKVHARTSEAKMQVALAELPYLRSRLYGTVLGSLQQQQGLLENLGGTGNETHIETRQKHLQERENKITKILTKLKNQRRIIRRARERKLLPIIAVVGYTNAGKTSLIKALTGEQDITPQDQLFATLDITAHAGKLLSGLKVIYIDTVGFMSNIPTGLIDAFSATLEDVVNADVVLHVRDISHPDNTAQKVHVDKTLKTMSLSQHIDDNMIEVCNKCDKITSLDSVKGDMKVSATTGEGLSELVMKIDKLVCKSRGIVVKFLKIQSDGHQLSWLYKEATVQDVTVDNNSNSLLVKALMSPAVYGRFRAKFTKNSLKA